MDTGSRQENASNQEPGASFRFNRNGALGARDTGDTQPFDEAIDEAAIIAEEQLLSRGLEAVVRLALQQFGGRRFRLRLLTKKTKRRRKGRKGLIGDIGLPRCPSGELGCYFVFAQREVRLGANVVETPQMAVARTEHGRPVEQRFRFDLPPVPQQIEPLGKIPLRKAWIEFQRKVQRRQRFIILKFPG